MVRRKKKSEVIDTAKSRLAGMKSISEKLDLGNGCTTAAVEARLKEAHEKLENYNSLLAQVAAAGNEFERAERALSNISKNILMGAAMKFDLDSDEYEMVGGVKLSDRKRARRKTEELVAV
ncbi:MAG: hypothetical protein HLUCCA11_10360 [Phormidesmis priestleyi Ana]|uniref:Uncharacterized protein n=1 Tax=Phormidesmis priestleyi Ana TaxID=1666911 RepID=A0A0P8DFZ3_9CYAN|nr:MAG: hypothetical protein HLUCCA11_10360 [Phormidesmis priestleyi Ana]